jgi:putative transcriptional regulator
MSIFISLDLVMVQKKMSLKELSERVGINLSQLSLFKNGKIKGIRFSTLDAICRELDCEPGDIIKYRQQV